MVRNDELDKLISDFKAVDTLDLNDEINAIFAEIMRVMGIRTINDTNQAKSIFVEACMNSFGIDISDIYGVTYDYWKNERSIGNGTFTSSVVRNKDGVNYTMTAYDNGLSAQEYNDTGLKYPSDVHAQETGRDNSQFIPHHLTITSDEVNAGQIASVQLKIDALMNKIGDLLEGRL